MVLEIGDSLGNDLGWGLARQLGATRGLTLVQRDKSSSGLSNSWFYDWPTRLAGYLAQYHPNLVVVCLGANDQQGMRVNGSGVQFNTPAWRVAYAEQIHRVVSLATRAGSYVLWVGLPVMGPNGYRQGTAVLNTLYAKVASAVPGVAYLPSWNVFATANGAYRAAARVNGVLSVLRQPDGIHFTLVGENVFSTFLTYQLRTIYHVALLPAAPVAITG